MAYFLVGLQCLPRYVGFAHVKPGAHPAAGQYICSTQARVHCLVRSNHQLCDYIEWTYVYKLHVTLAGRFHMYFVEQYSSSVGLNDGLRSYIKHFCIVLRGLHTARQSDPPA